MTDQLITIDRVGINDDVVQILLGPGAELPTNLAQVHKTLSECFERDDFEIILNMVHTKYPSSTFIALLIEATNVARRFGGDIKMINLPLSAKSNLVTFSAKTYLSIVEKEEYAYYDFGDESVVLPVTFVNSVDEKVSEPVVVTEPTAALAQNVSDSRFDFSQSKEMQGDKIKVQSQVDNLYEICDFVIDAAIKIGFDERERGKIKVTIYEACLNVIEHAYFSNPENWIEVSVFHDEQKLVVVIHDWGEGFEYHPSDEFDVQQAMNDRKTGGFGMHIIERSVDQIKYEPSEELGNRLYLLKYLER
ncbi:ATP-binding protein [candidate division KSB1 bacterium]|nr:ATP-binding protein [candidate division KSB1 bacterium]